MPYDPEHTCEDCGETTATCVCPEEVVEKECDISAIWLPRLWRSRQEDDDGWCHDCREIPCTCGEDTALYSGV